MKTQINKLVLVLLALFAISCSSDDGGDSSTPTPTVKDVYVVGYESSGGVYVPKYWKNGTATILETFAGGLAESIFVSGDDVYAAGHIYSGGGGASVAVYWKNGTIASLAASSDSYATGIFVSGTDVYVCGYEMSAGTYRARYWKNGVVYSLTDGTNNAYARGIFVFGSDVYVCGSENGSGGSTAKYWKNSVAVNLTTQANGCNATSITMVGNDIYVSGREGNDAVYWKNGTKTVVSTVTAGSYFQGNDIALNGTDVYVAGWEETPGPTQGRVWKNGAATNLNNYGYATGVCVSPMGDVYVSGRDISSAARIWINGTGTTLSASTSTDADAKGVFLTYN
ncbi:MAG: hypothetical protein V4648_08965 [Bacteroidota bacterium]